MTPGDYGILEGPITVPQSFHQLGILVLDGSGSMSEIVEGKISKAASVNTAVRELLTRLIVSKNKRDFSIAVITFGDAATVHTPVTRVYDDSGSAIDDNGDYDPMKGHGGGTDLAMALAEAGRIAEEFLSGAPPEGVPHSVIVVVMSDGMSQTDPRAAADEIKKNPKITVCSTLFALKKDTRHEAQEAKEMLQDIGSTPEHYKTVYDVETLRRFFIASMSSGRNVRIE